MIDDIHQIEAGDQFFWMGEKDLRFFFVVDHIDSRMQVRGEVWLERRAIDGSWPGGKLITEDAHYSISDFALLAQRLEE